MNIGKNPIEPVCIRISQKYNNNKSQKKSLASRKKERKKEIFSRNFEINSWNPTVSQAKIRRSFDRVNSRDIAVYKCSR